MLTVACVLKSGGIYDATWVARLRSAVAQHLPIAYRFICLSDVPDLPCERIPLKHDWPGWWSKIELFRLPGPVLFFDLDTAIVGDLSEIAAATLAADKLVMLRDFYRLGNGLGSGVMAWSEGDHFQRKLYDAFDVTPGFWMEHCPGGDQEFVEKAIIVDERRPLRWQDIVPGQVVSYKVHCRAGIPDNARVVCLHGRPKFADMPASDPVRLAWEHAA